MEALRQTQKKYGSRAMMAAIFTGFFLILAGNTDWGKGFMAIKFEQFNLFTVIIGIFMVQLVILADHCFILISSTRKKQ